MAMTRPGAICLTAALICAALAFAIPSSGASDNYSALMELILDNEDSHMNALDLAFLLATHSFDATPENGYVIVKLEGKIYSLTPNGEKPGLAEVTIVSNAQKE
jgi:hypothetical protein